MESVDFKGLVMEYLSIQEERDMNAQIIKLQSWKKKMNDLKKSTFASRSQMVNENLQ